MKFSELLKNLDSEELPYDGGGSFVEECTGGYGWVDLEGHGFTYRPISIWYCTDSWVGVNAVYLNGELICITKQWGRKCSVEYEWVSKEVYGKVSAFVRSLCEDELDNNTYIDLDSECEPLYTLEFTGHLIPRFHSEAIYNGKTVGIEWELTKKEERNDIIAKKVWILDGEAKCVDIKELKFPVKLSPDKH